jgi:hypothetical protein
LTPLEEQVEKLARELNLEAGRQRGWTDVDDWEYITEQERGGWRNMAKTAIAALLPLEVTDEMVEAGAKAIAADRNRGAWGRLPALMKAGYRDMSRACLSAALTQKGDKE